MTPVIAIDNLVKRYTIGDQEVRALNGVSLSVAHGEFLAVTGPSGSSPPTPAGLISFRDGRIVSDAVIGRRRIAADELDELPTALELATA